MYHLLVVEDEPDYANALVADLQGFGYQTTIAHNHNAALAALNQGIHFDLVLLDLTLNNDPVQDGLEVCQKIRARPNPPPIIMLTGSIKESDIVKGLDLGASDYITKPYTADILRARIKAVLRIRLEVKSSIVETVQPQPWLKIDARLQIERQKRKVYKDEKEVQLTPREFDLLLLLADHPGQVFSVDELLDQVWGSRYIDRRTVTKHISELRRKLEDDPHDPFYILTERGYGYKFRAR